MCVVGCCRSSRCLFTHIRFNQTLEGADARTTLADSATPSALSHTLSHTHSHTRLMCCMLVERCVHALENSLPRTSMYMVKWPDGPLASHQFTTSQDSALQNATSPAHPQLFPLVASFSPASPAMQCSNSVRCELHVIPACGGI